VSIKTSRTKSGAANPAPKLVSVIAGMCADAESIDDPEGSPRHRTLQPGVPVGRGLIPHEPELLIAQ
jgi:hypothetical protein